jgi:lipoprotein signal peptidase
MSDYTMENFSDVPTAVDGAAWSILNFMGDLTLQHIILGVVALFLLVFLVRHKRIMAEVRASLLTIAGVVSGTIHAIIAIGLYKVIW